jgi:outer membrane protein insertion porin family
VVPDPFFPLDVRVKHPYLGVQFILDTRADPVLATDGVFASVDLSGSGTFLGSDFRYVRLFTQFNLYRPLVTISSVPVTWAQSLRVGLAHAFNQELITDVRFFAGGAYSVRGYPDESLGPSEDLGGLVTPTGGQALLVWNEEVRFPLFWDLSGVAFFDAGGVWASTSDLGHGLSKSLGLGLRAITPLGVLRFDVARPLDRRPGDPSYELYLGFGQAF